VYLTIRQTTSGAPTDDLTVASCIPFIFKKSHKNGSAELWTEFLVTQKLSWDWELFTPSALRRLTRKTVFASSLTAAVNF